MRASAVAASAIAFATLTIHTPRALAVEPTAFERFATDAATSVTSRVVGSLTALDATVEVAALVAVARAEGAVHALGARFELSNNGGREHVYLDRPQLERLLMELDLMELGKQAAARMGQETTRGTRVTGTESCWMPRPVQRILCPEIVASPAWNGLRLWTFGGAEFAFRDRTSTELRALVERAVTALNEMPE